MTARARLAVSPHGIDWLSPGRRDYAVRFEHPTLWGWHTVPVTLLVGPQAQPGRGVAAIGSTHGDEYEGPVAIKELMQQVELDRVLGRLVLIPTLNVAAFRAGTRDTPDDGKNLNRCFPGNPRGTLTDRFADFITTQVFPQVHTVIDLHAGGQVARFAPCMSFHRVADPAQRRQMEQTARAFGTPFILQYQDETPGLLTSTAERLGKITIGSELGWGQAVNRTGVSMARQGLLAAMVAQEQLRGPAPSHNHTPFDRQVMVDSTHLQCYVAAERPGWFEPVVDLGAAVSAGEPVGRLHDFDRIDEPPMDICAPHAGYVICQAWRAKVERGQAVALVAETSQFLS